MESGSQNNDTTLDGLAAATEGQDPLGLESN